MSTTTNSGRSFFIQTVTVTTVDTPVTIPTSEQLPNQIDSLLIRCRSGADMYLKLNQGDGNYFTIPGNSSLTLDISPRGTPMFYLVSSSGTVVAEILATLE